MQTFEQKLKEQLVAYGMFEDWADEVIGRLKSTDVTKSMEGRWGDEVSGYPDSVYAILWVSAKREALEYIKENCPQAWFRPMFDDEMAKELGLDSQ
jgi:hypothetical protein